MKATSGKKHRPAETCGAVVISCDSKRRKRSIPRNRPDMVNDEPLGVGGVMNLVVFAPTPRSPTGDQAEFPTLVGRDLDASAALVRVVIDRAKQDQPVDDLVNLDRLHIVFVRHSAYAGGEFADPHGVVFDDLAFRHLGGDRKRRFRLPRACPVDRAAFADLAQNVRDEKEAAGDPYVVDEIPIRYGGVVQRIDPLRHFVDEGFRVRDFFDFGHVISLPLRF